jgi:hypothetical protein
MLTYDWEKNDGEGGYVNENRNDISGEDVLAEM